MCHFVISHQWIRVTLRRTSCLTCFRSRCEVLCVLTQNKHDVTMNSLIMIRRNEIAIPWQVRDNLFLLKLFVSISRSFEPWRTLRFRNGLTTWYSAYFDGYWIDFFCISNSEVFVCPSRSPLLLHYLRANIRSHSVHSFCSRLFQTSFVRL